MSTIVDDGAPIGARVKEERTRKGWSLTELADASGVSRAMISRIERGESSPTAALLGRLSAAFELSVSALLRRDPAADGAPAVRRQADVPHWSDPATGYGRRQISTPAFPVDVTEVILPSGAEVPYPAAAYAFIAQLLWVLEGELTVVDGDETHELSAGDCFELGAPRPRVYRNRTSLPCRYVVVVSRRAEA